MRIRNTEDGVRLGFQVMVMMNLFAECWKLPEEERLAALRVLLDNPAYKKWVAANADEIARIFAAVYRDGAQQ